MLAVLKTDTPIEQLVNVDEESPSLSLSEEEVTDEERGGQNRLYCVGSGGISMKSCLFVVKCTVSG